MKWHWKNISISLQRFANRRWFIPFVAFLAAIDAFIVFIPNEAFLISAVVVRPKQWIRIGVWVSVGSAIGAAFFAWLVGEYGEPLVNYLFPSLLNSKTWIESSKIINDHGTWGLAIVSFSPLPQHAAVAIAGLAHLRTVNVLISVFFGRLIKYLFVAWCSTHSPKLLKKFGGSKFVQNDKTKTNDA